MIFDAKKPDITDNTNPEQEFMFEEEQVSEGD